MASQTATTSATPEPPIGQGAPPQVASAAADSGRVKLAAGVGLAAALVWAAMTAVQKIKELQGEKKLMPLILEAARQTNVPPSVLAAIVRKESSFSNKPTSYSAGCKVDCIASKNCAIGVAQVLPETAKMSAQQLCNPANSLIAGARYLRTMFTTYRSQGNSDERSWYLAALAYNQGPGNVAGWLTSGRPTPCGTNKFPDGSRSVSKCGLAYADKVTGWAEGYRNKGIAGLPPMQAPAFLTAPQPSRNMRANMFRGVHA